MHAWQVLKVSRDENALPGMWLFEEPFFYNDFICAKSLKSASLRSALREAGCTKIGHLFKAMHYFLVELGKLANIRSEKMIKKIVEEVCESLPQSLNDFASDCDVISHWEDGCEYVFPFLDVSLTVEATVCVENSFLSFSNVQLGSFEELGKKQIYILCVRVLHMRSLEEAKPLRWFDFFGQDQSVKYLLEIFV